MPSPPPPSSSAACFSFSWEFSLKKGGYFGGEGNQETVYICEIHRSGRVEWHILSALLFLSDKFLLLQSLSPKQSSSWLARTKWTNEVWHSYEEKRKKRRLTTSGGEYCHAMLVPWHSANLNFPAPPPTTCTLEGRLTRIWTELYPYARGVCGALHG